MAIDPKAIGKRIPYWQEEPMSLSEWQEAIERNVRSLNVDLNDLVTSVNRLSRFLVGQPITAGAIPTALTADLSLAAAMESIVQKTPPSSPSGQGDTPSGRAEPSSECAHGVMRKVWLEERVGENHWQTWWCSKCGALRRGGKIRVPGAVETSSTSPKQDSKSSAAPSGEVFATSPSSLGTDRCDWCNQTRDWHVETWRGHVFQKTAGVSKAYP